MYSNVIQKRSNNGYSWYECCCCPYGYHIDLDFVRYCESVSKESDRTGSIKRRKDRRRQRQSMEVLLGITPPIIAVLEQTYKPIQEQEAKNQINANCHNFHDGFDDAVSDFERTLQRSKHKLSNNLPDVTAVSETIKRTPSISSISSTSGSSMTVLPETADGANNRDFDTVSIESCGMSPLALQNIREQMALSLERTIKLEEQVKLIPQLKDQISNLKNENRRLLLQLKCEENANMNVINANYLCQSPTSKIKSLSYNELDSLDRLEKRRTPPPPPPRRDCGVMCGVLTRNIGVGHQNPNTKSVSTTILNGELSCLLENTVKAMVTGATQTLQKELRSVGSQSMMRDRTVPKSKANSYCQTVGAMRRESANIGVLAVPLTFDFGAQFRSEVYSVGVSDDTISDVVCEKCNAFKCTVGVGPEAAEDAHTSASAVSLSSLLTSKRSKSFNLGDDRLDLNTRKRTVACQYESKRSPSKATQYEPNGVSRACQCEVRQNSKAVQYERRANDKYTQSPILETTSKLTDTKDLNSDIERKDVACEARSPKTQTSNIGCNTATEAAAVSTTPVCQKCFNNNSREKEDTFGRKDGSPTPSRIPRLQMPTTPVENRKFKRQDTYTKIYSTPTGAVVHGLSGLDLSSKTDSLDNVLQNYKLQDIPTANSENGSGSNNENVPLTKVQIQETTLPVPETALYQSTTQNQRKKVVPSKEMQGAMKVLNDSLLKHQTKNLKNHSAISIVQQEWFKISSLVTANPLDVEDYLDSFEDMSSHLLEYIVNTTDDSGNTAMHYAVSHGNFDVVSILLDSKVCDINKPNKAGYTCVMLVSLAEVRSSTHGNVVKRLFQLADVNLRAKQHGQTALMLAVSHGRLDMVKMLLEAGADVNIQDEDGSTALMCAAEHGHMEIVKHFLSHPDCNSSIIDVDGSTALKIAMEAGHRHIGVLLYAHERNLHNTKAKKSKPASPRTPSSPLPLRSSHRALTDTKTTK